MPRLQKPVPPVLDERKYSEAQWTEATRRRERLVTLARSPNRTVCQVNAVAAELGLKERPCVGAAATNYGR